jgi:hypothetical protein
MIVMNAWTDWMGILGPLSVSILLFILGRLSRKLGSVTQAKPYHMGFHVSALLVAISALIRVARLTGWFPLSEAETWGLLYNGLFALGVTLGVVFAWRYWSWLLAERN